MIDKAAQGRLEIQEHGAIVRHGKHIDAEARFQRRVFIENIGYNIGELCRV